MSILDALIANTIATDEKWQYKHLTDAQLREKLREGFVVLFKQRFAADYWALSKDWKQLTYQQVALELLAEIDIIIDMVIKDKES